MTTRDDTIRLIRTALFTRSGKAWSVTGGRGTAWGWIRIDAPPRDRTFNVNGTAPTNGGSGFMSAERRAELATLLGLDRPVHCQGVSIPSQGDYYDEYIARAKGEPPTVIGEPYWD